MPADPDPVLLSAAFAVQGELSPSDGSVLHSFDLASLVLLLVPVIQSVLAQCTRTPESIRELARAAPGSSRDVVYKVARPIVASRYSLAYRLLRPGKITREAEQLAAACVTTAAKAEAERIGEVLIAARRF